MQVITRILCCVATSTAYQIATNPFLLALMLCLWDFRAGAGLVALYAGGCVGAVKTSKVMHSPLTGFPIITPPRGSLFWLFGNDQDGLWVDWHRAKYSPRWRWLAPFMWTFWRNKLRNLPFVRCLEWLHIPPNTPEVWRYYKVRGVLIELYWRGWMTELKWSVGKYFGDIGPRLDQPVTWGAVSWAFRPFGRV